MLWKLTSSLSLILSLLLASLARAACKLMCEEGKIAPVETHHSQQIYTRVAAV